LPAAGCSRGSVEQAGAPRSLWRTCARLSTLFREISVRGVRGAAGAEETAERCRRVAVLFARLVEAA
jgi:hypothetical protein